MLTTSAPSSVHLSPPTARNAPPPAAPALRTYAASKSPSPAIPLSSASPITSSSSIASPHSWYSLSQHSSPALIAGRYISLTTTATRDAGTQVTSPLLHHHHHHHGGHRSPRINTTAPTRSGSLSGAKRKEPSSPSYVEAPETPAEPSVGPSSATGQVLPATPAASNVGSTSAPESGAAPAKRARPPAAAKKVMPARYERCDVKDLVPMIAAMLMELIRFNDAIPLADGRLTRFHSRAPPGISVHDYLQRLTTHATLSPPLLLSMVYYIDRLCTLYPAFTISSLTVHRFLIASATVASKGLSDLFWTNNTYARVGGISLKELKVLELEFLHRVEWRIVPQPEVLENYYRSLIARTDEYVLEGDADEEEVVVAGPSGTTKEEKKAAP